MPSIHSRQDRQASPLQHNNPVSDSAAMDARPPCREPENPYRGDRLSPRWDSPQRRDIDRAARSRFDSPSATRQTIGKVHRRDNPPAHHRDVRPRIAPADSPINARAFEAGLERWANEEKTHDEERARAKDLIMAAYSDGRHELSLASLHLGSLPAEVFQLRRLQHLNLEGNNIAPLPGEIGNLTDLKHLNLSSNGLTGLPAEIGQLRALETLNLRANQMDQWPCEIGNLSALTSLTLTANQLSHLPPQIGQLKALTTLEVNFNEIHHLPAEIGQLSALESLNLNNNALNQLPAEIGQLSALSSLQLNNNRLGRLPTGIRRLSALASLDLSNNRLGRLPKGIGQLAALSELHLHQNQLTQLPASIGQLRGLQTLSLHHNQLTRLPRTLRRCTALASFSLNSNRLTHIDIERLPQNYQLRINLQDNLFSSNTVQALNQAQNEADYSGPELALSIVSSQAIQHLSAANLKELLAQLGHSGAHPAWTALEQRCDMGDIANDFTLLLAKVYNEAPRENDRLSGRITGHITRVLTTLEQLHSQSTNDPSKRGQIEDLLHNAHDSVSECVDRAAIHLLLMSAKSLHHQSGNPQAMADYHSIHRTIDFVARLNKNDERKLVFDNDSGTFRPFIEMTGESYQDFRIGDEVEDILTLLNSGLLKSIDGCDMRFGNCATLTAEHHLTAARHYIIESLG